MYNVSFRQLQVFVCIAQSHTFAQAAEKMCLSQPALSSAIKKMESQLGGLLFSRTTRKVELSPEGRQFLPVAERLIDDWQEAFSDVHNLFSLGRGKLSIAAMPSFAAGLLPGILQQFKTEFPNIKLSVADVVMETVIKDVQAGRAEIGFAFEHDKMDGLEFHPILTDNFIAVLPVNHPLSDNEILCWSQLSLYPFVAMNKGSAIRQWIDAFMAINNLSLNIVVEASQLATLGQFVKHDLGVSVVPALCQEQMLSKDLVCLQIHQSGLSKRVGIIRQKNGNLSSVASSFWQWTVKNISYSD
ncbi:LysR family transcriptional regulator [uncultured Paraglaciecola sp.]|uniref:LysR family transcriptional regulator n=1 Tax=uncultured Paraglaciecola sp. TaxID=1765024 RepID=UPI0030D7AA7D|tara:strand:- start:10103 stop:11002 length:900 start_codon:yes stop_codon:yes gene_type:complete